MCRHHIRKLKITCPFEISVPSDIRPFRTLTFHLVLARQGSSFCNRACLNFQAFALRDTKVAALACTQAVGWSKKAEFVWSKKSEFVMMSPSWIRATRSGPGWGPSPRSLCQPSTKRANPRWRPHYEFRFFSTIQPPACRLWRPKKAVA